MTKYNWNYQEMGFNSETEMKASIARVERQMKLDSLELERERRSKARDDFDKRGGIDFNALNDGVRLERLDQQVYSRIVYEKEQADIQKKQEEMNELLTAFSEKITADNEAKAQREMQKEQEKLEADLQKEIYSKHNVKTDEEKERDETLSKMLESLIK